MAVRISGLLQRKGLEKYRAQSILPFIIFILYSGSTEPQQLLHPELPSKKKSLLLFYFVLVQTVWKACNHHITDEESEAPPGEGYLSSPAPHSCLSQGPQPRVLLGQISASESTWAFGNGLNPRETLGWFRFTENVLTWLCSSSMALGNVSVSFYLKLVCKVPWFLLLPSCWRSPGLAHMYTKQCDFGSIWGLVNWNVTFEGAMS